MQKEKHPLTRRVLFVLGESQIRLPKQEAEERNEKIIPKTQVSTKCT